MCTLLVFWQVNLFRYLLVLHNRLDKLPFVFPFLEGKSSPYLQPTDYQIFKTFQVFQHFSTLNHQSGQEFLQLPQLSRFTQVTPFRSLASVAVVVPFCAVLIPS